MRLICSAAAALVAVFASSDATSTGVDANALLESDVSLVARVTNGNAYDADRQRLLRESLDDDELMLPVDNEERAEAAQLVEETAPILGTALSGRLHTGLANEGASARLAETAVANAQRAEESQGRAITRGQHTQEIQPKMSVFAWVKSLWTKLKEWLTKHPQEFVQWIKSFKAKDKPVGERNTADADIVKKSKAANEVTSGVGNGGAGRGVDSNGAANAGGHSTGEKLKPLVGGAVRAAAGGEGKPTTLETLFRIHKTGCEIVRKANHAAFDIGSWESLERQGILAGARQTAKDLYQLIERYGKKSAAAGGGTTSTAWSDFVTWRLKFVRNINVNVVVNLENLIRKPKEVDDVENKIKVANEVKKEIKEFVDSIERQTSDTFRTFLGMDDPAAAATATLKMTDKSHS